METETISDAFKFAPAIVALLLVIFMMYKLIISRDTTIAKMVVGSQEDIARQSKILALLEILVQRGASFRNGNNGYALEGTDRRTRPRQRGNDGNSS